MGETWRVIGRCIEGDELLIDGVNVWDYEWLGQGDAFMVYDPHFRRAYRHRPYLIEVGGHRIEFGACETSNNVWAFSAIQSETGES